MNGHRRLGLFGGSFDPVHCGHIQLARAAQKEFRLDAIFFIPARIPPHKLDKHLIPAATRKAMFRLALAPHPRFRISSVELQRAGTTYTYQTLKYFKKRFPRADLFFLIGSDSLCELSTWKKPEEILSLCTLIVGKRTGVRLPRNASYRDRVCFLSRPVPRISSTVIRGKAAAGASLRGLVPPAVERFIKKRGLYR